MSDSVLITIEIIFNVLYLITIWSVVFLMYHRRSVVQIDNLKIAQLFMICFFLLAFGDTGHVGFRVIAYASGGLEANPLLVGLGALATAITVTFFYILTAEIWRVRFSQKRNVIWWILIIIGIIRLGIMIPTSNNWGSVVPPFDWSLARNIPLMIQGLGVAVLLLVFGKKQNDQFSIRVALMIFVSYLCYIPVILFIQKVPILGMLMIPKTLAYIAIAFLALSLFKKEKVS